MDVFIYRAKDRNGYLYDISFNPEVDFEILKRTRKIERMDIITPGISLAESEEVLKKVYGASSIFGRLINSHDMMINNILKRLNIKRIEKRVVGGFELPSLQDISRVEEFLMGKIMNLKMVMNMKNDMGISYNNIIDIIQTLYCERRIKIKSAIKKQKNKRICHFCDKEKCSYCLYGFDNDDIFIYAADNYNLHMVKNINPSKKKLSESSKETYDELVNFIRSRKEWGILWAAPNAFEYEVAAGAITEVIKRGGKVLYLASNSKMFEVKEAFKKAIGEIEIDITNGFYPNSRYLHMAISSYAEPSYFYKAFDLVILDEQYSFLERPTSSIDYLSQRAVKESGKFMIITCCPDSETRKMLKGSADIISIPVSHIKNPIPEPRIVTSRFLDGAESFIPPMAMDVIKWSLGEGAKIIIFVPDESAVHKVYYYLTYMEGFERDIIEVSDGREIYPIINFKKGEFKILISMDIKDATHIIEDVNVIVMYSDNEIYHVDTLINISSMAVRHIKKNMGEVVFIASQETEVMSLAKSTIRNINKVAWEKGYIKR